MEIWNFSVSVENISLVRCAHSWNIFSTWEEKFRISMQLCNIFSVLFCHLVWKHLGILTCFKLMWPERIKKYGYKKCTFLWNTCILSISWSFSEAFIFETDADNLFSSVLCRNYEWTCHFIYMFVSVLCSILKYKLLLCFFFFCFVVQIILSYLVWAKLVLSLPFFCPLCQCNLFTCPLDQYLKRFSIQFQGPEFFNSLSREIRNSESVGLFGKDLKSSFFLSHIYMVPFVERHTFSFFFL